MVTPAFEGLAMEKGRLKDGQTTVKGPGNHRFYTVLTSCSL